MEWFPLQLLYWYPTIFHTALEWCFAFLTTSRTVVVSRALFFPSGYWQYQYFPSHFLGVLLPCASILVKYATICRRSAINSVLLYSFSGSGSSSIHNSTPGGRSARASSTVFTYVHHLGLVSYCSAPPRGSPLVCSFIASQNHPPSRSASIFLFSFCVYTLSCSVATSSQSTTIIHSHGLILHLLSKVLTSFHVLRFCSLFSFLPWDSKPPYVFSFSCHGPIFLLVDIYSCERAELVD